MPTSLDPLFRPESVAVIADLTGVETVCARRKLLEIIRYDAEIRNLVISRGGLDADMLDFLFGRPLTQTLGNYGIKIQQEGTQITPMLQR